MLCIRCRKGWIKFEIFPSNASGQIWEFLQNFTSETGSGDKLEGLRIFQIKIDAQSFKLLLRYVALSLIPMCFGHWSRGVKGGLEIFQEDLEFFKAQSKNISDSDVIKAFKK